MGRHVSAQEAYEKPVLVWCQKQSRTWFRPRSEEGGRALGGLTEALVEQTALQRLSTCPPRLKQGLKTGPSDRRTFAALYLCRTLRTFHPSSTPLLVLAFWAMEETELKMAAPSSLCSALLPTTTTGRLAAARTCRKEEQPLGTSAGSPSGTRGV